MAPPEQSEGPPLLQTQILTQTPPPVRRTHRSQFTPFLRFSELTPCNWTPAPNVISVRLRQILATLHVLTARHRSSGGHNLSALRDGLTRAIRDQPRVPPSSIMINREPLNAMHTRREETPPGYRLASPMASIRSRASTTCIPLICRRTNQQFHLYLLSSPVLPSAFSPMAKISQLLFSLYSFLST